MANSVDTDEAVHYEPSHLDLHCLQNNLSRSTGSKGLSRDEKKKKVGKIIPCNLECDLPDGILYSIVQKLVSAG